MRASLAQIIRARVALYHLRKMAEHGERSVAVNAGAPLFMHNIVAAAMAVAVFMLAQHFRP